MQDALEIFENFLRSKNLKHSKPRSDILNVFLVSEGHLSAQELYDQVKQKNPRVGFATVYRTLKLLEECGLARSMDYGDGTQRYEPDRFQHHHIMKARKFKNTKTNSEQSRIGGWCRLNFAVQENIDFKALFRYKKASTEREETCQGDSAEALSKENRRGTP